MASIGLGPSFGQRNWAHRPHYKVEVQDPMPYSYYKNLGTINCTIGLIMLDIK